VRHPFTFQTVPRNAKKQCADKHLGTKFRQRGISLYLAISFLPLILS
jgi:hypothetical protein